MLCDTLVCELLGVRVCAFHKVWSARQVNLGRAKHLDNTEVMIQ